MTNYRPVRIAVAVNAKGDVRVAYTPAPLSFRGSARDLLEECYALDDWPDDQAIRCSWVKADLPMPEPQEEAEVRGEAGR